MKKKQQELDIGLETFVQMTSFYTKSAIDVASRNAVDERVYFCLVGLHVVFYSSPSSQTTKQRRTCWRYSSVLGRYISHPRKVIPAMVDREERASGY